MKNKPSSFDEYLEVIEDEPENSDIKLSFLDFMIDSLIRNKNIDREKYKNKIKTIIKEDPNKNYYFHQSYLTFLNNDKKKQYH